MNNFRQEDLKKYQNFLITSQKYHTPPYNWSGGIFQRFKPVSGDFLIGDNVDGTKYCVNNQTGRGYYANPCGYWNNDHGQFNEGIVKHDIQKTGTMFPVNKFSNSVMTTPNDRIVFGYSRIGEEFRSR